MPNRFLNHFGGNISGTITLGSPDGNPYDVEVTKGMSKTVLQHGWEAFVDDHYIEENDSVLFRHIEKSRFEVLILDSHDCEKVISCVGIKNTSYIEERRVGYADNSTRSCDDATQSFGSKSFAGQRASSSGCREAETMAAEICSSEESGYIVDVLAHASHSVDYFILPIGSFTYEICTGQDSPSKNESFESDDLQPPPRPAYVLSCRSYLSDAEKDKVIALIQEVQPEATVFVAIMRKCNVQQSVPYVIIPKDYAAAHFPHKSVIVTLLRPHKSKKWHPKFYEREGCRTVCMLKGQQWLHFVRDNRLQEGDICLFVPTKGGRRFTFTVHVLQKSGAAHSRAGTDVQRDDPIHGKTTTKRASAVHIKEEPIDGEISSEGDNTRKSFGIKRFTAQRPSSSRCRENVNMTVKFSSSEESGEDSASEDECFEPDDLQPPPRPAYVLSRMCYLSDVDKGKVKSLIQEVQPEATVFVAIMRKSNVKPLVPSVIISKEYAVEHFPPENAIVTLQMPDKNKKWYPTFYKRKDRTVYMLKGQWLDFVRENHVQKGDLCLFVPTKGGIRFTFTVHVLHKSAAAHSRDRTGVLEDGSSHGKTAIKKASTVLLKEEPLDGDDISSESDRNDVTFNSLESKDTDNPPEPSYILPVRRRLSHSQNKLAKEKVIAIQSEIPIYVAIMNNYNERLLEFDSRYAGLYLPNRKQTVVLQCMGKIWTINMLIYNHNRNKKKLTMTVCEIR